VFLGGSRDYLLELACGAQVRVTAPAEQSVPPGSPVWLHMPAARCRALAN
jgi:iron(III) transport system ATP-binding protein